MDSISVFNMEQIMEMRHNHGEN